MRSPVSVLHRIARMVASQGPDDQGHSTLPPEGSRFPQIGRGRGRLVAREARHDRYLEAAGEIRASIKVVVYVR